MMKSLSKTSDRIFRRIVEGLDDEGRSRSRRIGEKGRAFMPLSVERLHETGIGVVYSLAHYFEQNGDLCCDPDMTFLVNDLGVFPLSFQQAMPPIYQEAVVWDDGGHEITGIRRRMQADLARFANQWMRNIKSQHADYFKRQPAALQAVEAGEVMA